MNLSRKVAIVTGSSKGIGWAIARKLGQEGARIVLNGRDPAHLDKTLSILHAEGLDVVGFQGDISDEKVCLNMVDFAERNFGHIDILINNAGISAKGFFQDLPPGIFLHLIQTNIIGGLNATRAALPQLKSHQGSVLFISSLAGLRAIRNRQFKTAVGWKGKTYYLISKYFPSLLDYTFCHHLDFIEQNDS